MEARMTKCKICKKEKEDEEIIWHISGRLVCHDCFNDLLKMPRIGDKIAIKGKGDTMRLRVDW